MVDKEASTVEQSTAEAAEVQAETVAPWQEQEREQEQEQVEHGHGLDPAESQDAQQEEQVPGEGEQENVEDPLAGLGSVDDIAAAALQAANLTGIFGDSSEESRGTKRSHDAMSEAQEEVSVMEQFSTVAPDPATEEEHKAPSPPSTSTATTFQNSFSQFQAEAQPSAGQQALAVSAAAEKHVPASTSGIGSGSLDATAAVSGTNAVPVAAAVAQPTSIVDSGAASAPSQEGAGMAGLPMIGFHDLQAVAQAAMGLDANGNPLPGNEESHRALAEAVKRLSAAQGITLPTSNETEGHGQDSASGEEGNNGGPVKRFQCTQCERAFARAYNLNTHLATHDPDPARSKPFPCPYPSCKTDGGRSFSRKHDLQRHVASTHENEPEPGIDGSLDEGRQTGGLASLGLGTPGRKFRCEGCGRAFVRRDALKRHQCTRVMESSPPKRSVDVPDYYSNAAAGLSLYTSNASTAPSAPQSKPAAQAASEGGSYESDPFGPNGITYESLSKEVQDMAMQLVAQAQSYNEQQHGPQQPGTQPSQAVQASESVRQPPTSNVASQQGGPNGSAAGVKSEAETQAERKEGESVPTQVSQAGTEGKTGEEPVSRDVRKEVSGEKSSVDIPSGTQEEQQGLPQQHQQQQTGRQEEGSKEASLPAPSPTTAVKAEETEDASLATNSTTTPSLVSAQ